MKLSELEISDAEAFGFALLLESDGLPDALMGIDERIWKSVLVRAASFLEVKLELESK